MKSGRVRGLSMVEVLAAMVIFSSGAVVLFGWIGQTTDRLGKLSAEQNALFVKLAALDYAKTINPMAQPTGVVELHDRVTLRWSSQLVGEVEPVRPAGGVYDVALYRVELRAEAEGGRSTVSSIYLAGWKQARELRQSNPFGGA